jgi:hypothetical protein
MNEPMDLSPLPHKAPFVVVAEVESISQITSSEQNEPPSMEDIQDSLMEGLQQPAPLE